MPGTLLQHLRAREDADAAEGGAASVGDENEAGEDETTPLLRRNPRVQ